MSSEQYIAQGDMSSGNPGGNINALTYLERHMLGRNGQDLSLVVRTDAGTQGALAGFMASVWQVMPEFAGEIILVPMSDSDINIEAMLAVYGNRYRIRVCSGQALASEGNVQHAMSQVSTPWALLLTDHMVFVRNPLDVAIAEISSTGAHFLSFHASVRGVADRVVTPRFIEILFLNGRSIALVNSTQDGFFGAAYVGRSRCPYLSLDICLVFVPSWHKLGAFKPSLVGQYLDFDFSMRVFSHGFKAVAIIAGGIEQQSVSGNADYSLVPRSDGKVLKEDADFQVTMLREYGLEVRTSLEPNELNLQLATYRQSGMRDWMGALNPEPSLIPAQSKPRIALIIDSEYWAFANIARQIVRYLSHKYDFVIIPTGVVDSLSRILLMCQGCDLVHFFWREYLTLIDSQYFKDYNFGLGYADADFHQRYIKPLKLTGAVYDHLFLSEPEILTRKRLFTEIMCGYTVSSRRLQDIYSRIDVYPNPTQETADGVDLTLFKPKNLERFESIGQRPLVVGWAGNSKWAGEQEDFKGFHSILMPVIEQLREEGLEFDLHLADRQLGFISHHDMPDYYSRIDLYICPSKIEGTPNPVLESMACGVPVLSTDVGIVPEAFGPLQMEFIFERSIANLKNKLRYFYMNRQELAPALSKENRDSVKKWDWSVKAKNFELFFDNILSK